MNLFHPSPPFQSPPLGEREPDGLGKPFLRVFCVFVFPIAAYILLRLVNGEAKLDPRYFSMGNAVAYIASVVTLLWVSIRGALALKQARYRIPYAASAATLAICLILVFEALAN